jgi:hypothetical protein
MVAHFIVQLQGNNPKICGTKSGEYINGASMLSGQLSRFDFIYITPDPGLSRLNRPYKRMFRLMKMFRSMLVLRRVTATNVPADKAHTQVHPRITHLYTLLTHMHGRLSYFDLIKMGTFLRH